MRGRTSKMSHDHGRRAACRMTSWIVRLHLENREVARGVTDMVVGSGALLALWRRRPRPKKKGARLMMEDSGLINSLGLQGSTISGLRCRKGDTQDSESRTFLSHGTRLQTGHVLTAANVRRIPKAHRR